MGNYSSALAQLREDRQYFLETGADNTIMDTKLNEPAIITAPKNIVVRPKKVFVTEEVDETTAQEYLKKTKLQNWIDALTTENKTEIPEEKVNKKDKKDKIEVLLPSRVNRLKDNEVQKRPGEPIANIMTNQQMTEGYPGRSGGAYQRSFFGDKVKGSPKKESLVEKSLMPKSRVFKKDTPVETNKDTVYEVQSLLFTDGLGDREGVVAGDITTGKTEKQSLPYGIVDDKGVKREDYIEGPKGDKTFAAAVVKIHYKELDEKFQEGGHNLKSMPKEVQYAFLDLHWNHGSVGKDTVTYFNPKDMTKSLNNTLEFLGTTRKNNEQIAQPSIAGRRIVMYNKAAKATGKPKIQFAEMTKSGSGTLVVYRDVNKKEIYSFTHPYKLANVSKSKATIERKSATWRANSNTWDYK